MMVVNSLLNPAQLKQAGKSKSKGKPKTKDDLLALVPEEGSIPKNVLILQRAQDIGIGEKRANAFLAELLENRALFLWLIKRPRTNQERRISGQCTIG